MYLYNSETRMVFSKIYKQKPVFLVTLQIPFIFISIMHLGTTITKMVKITNLEFSREILYTYL